jgi:hypothetical protein
MALRSLEISRTKALMRFPGSKRANAFAATPTNVGTSYGFLTGGEKSELEPLGKRLGENEF